MACALFIALYVRLCASKFKICRCNKRLIKSIRDREKYNADCVRILKSYQVLNHIKFFTRLRISKFFCSLLIKIYFAAKKGIANFKIFVTIKFQLIKFKFLITIMKSLSSIAQVELSNIFFAKNRTIHRR